MTFHTIQHPRKRKIRQAGTPWNRIVTGGAIDAELLLDLEMRDVRELHVNVLSGHRNRGDQATGLREAGILDLFRRMTTAASGRIERCVQSRFYARLGVAGGALGMTRELRKDALLVEFVAERAVRAEPRLRIDAGLLIDVQIV